MAAPLKRPQGLRQWAAFLIATALGAGLVPIAPGTAGSLIALPLPLVTLQLPMGSRILAWLALTGLGIWAAKNWDQFQKSSDNQSIVIDEVVGLWLTAWTAESWTTLLAAFVVFRFFDVVKIPPVRQVDRWSKKKAAEGTPTAAWWGGFGVVADDVLAGIQGLAVIMALQKWGMLP
jgi:phosphatidylglycerophosphatase A